MLAHIVQEFAEHTGVSVRILTEDRYNAAYYVMDGVPGHVICINERFADEAKRVTASCQWKELLAKNTEILRMLGVAPTPKNIILCILLHELGHRVHNARIGNDEYLRCHDAHAAACQKARQDALAGRILASTYKSHYGSGLLERYANAFARTHIRKVAAADWADLATVCQAAKLAVDWW